MHNTHALVFQRQSTHYNIECAAKTEMILRLTFVGESQGDEGAKSTELGIITIDTRLLPLVSYGNRYPLVGYGNRL